MQDEATTDREDLVGADGFIDLPDRRDAAPVSA
jgi:hypothetical protein